MSRLSGAKAYQKRRVELFLALQPSVGVCAIGVNSFHCALIPALPQGNC
jgi:hypothetical protein